MNRTKSQAAATVFGALLPLSTSCRANAKRRRINYLEKCGWLLALSALTLQPPAVHAQGNLTPPGPPAPTMKSLDQIEPRTPISSAPFTVTQPGSYYLTHNLTVSSGDAIDVNANGVTLDLDGFTISSTENPAATGFGIRLNSVTNITIVNGIISSGVTNNGSGSYSGPGFGIGIEFAGVQQPENARVSRVSISGCFYDGIYLNYGNSTVVEGCTVQTVGGYGIVASSIKSCVALDCGNPAIFGDQVSDCRGQSNFGYGLQAYTCAQNCYGSSGGGPGLAAANAQNCSGYSSGNNPGLIAGGAQNCIGYSSSGNGLVAGISALNCYGHSDGDGTGLSANLVVNSSGDSLGSGFGVAGNNVNNSQGSSQSGTGLSAQYIASFSSGNSASGTGLAACIANSCYIVGGGSSISFKYNMP